MEENIEYQQVASTIEKVYTKAASTKMSLPNLQVPLKKFLPKQQVPKCLYQIFKYHCESFYRIIAELLLSPINVLPMSHLNNGIEVV